MKKNITIGLYIMISIVVFSKKNKVYKSATEFDYPPFSVTENGKADGFSVELLKAVANEVGIEIELNIMISQYHTWYFMVIFL